MTERESLLCGEIESAFANLTIHPIEWYEPHARKLCGIRGKDPDVSSPVQIGALAIKEVNWRTIARELRDFATLLKKEAQGETS